VDNQDARRAERFDSLDRNRNGRIDSREWDGTVAAFNRLDANNDNILSRAEMVSADVDGAPAVATSGQTTRAELAQRFDRMDLNTNGRVELREWNGSAAAFDRLDVNNDNFLSRAEMAGPEVDNTPAAGASGQAIRVEGRERWTDTGINVRAGDTLVFDAQGTVRLSGDGNDIAGVGGARSGRRAPDAPLVNQTAGALIARIGNSDTFFVGNRRSVQAPASGRLYLGVNDDYLEDNSGDFQVMVTVQR
jgi:Ca2+-binding EF-hand superfamily protein